MDNYINTVLNFLEEAGNLALERQDALDIKVKLDNSIVTNIDIEISKLFRKSIKKFLDIGHTLLDEENLIDKNELFNKNAEYIWTIDPIDGTTTYASGFPTWAIAVSLYKNFEPILGFIFMPRTSELVYTDSKSVYYISEVFKNEQSIKKIEPSKMVELNRKSIIMAHRLKNYNVDKYTVLDFYSTYVSAFYTIIHKSVGSFINKSASLWDVTAILPFLKPCNLICKNVVNNKNVNSMLDVELDNSWKLSNVYLICNSSNYQDIISIFTDL